MTAPKFGEEGFIPKVVPTGFRLDKLDLDSRTWQRLKKHMEGRLDKLRRENDKDIDPIQTARLRGRIEVFKDLLALGDSQTPAMVADEE